MSNRDSVGAKAQRALQILQNPEFKATFDAQRNQIISELEKIKLDGSPEIDRQVVELVRKLQSAISFKREFVRLVEAGDRAERRDKANPTDPLR